MTIKIVGGRLLLIAHHPAWKALIEGEKKAPMVWLKKATTPIPIVTDSGAVIFRRVTAQSLRSGGWVFPGRKPSGFKEKAEAKTREFLSRKLPPLLSREITRSLGGRK